MRAVFFGFRHGLSVALLGAACSLLIPQDSIALAQSFPPSVSARVDACVPIDDDQFHRLLAIELGNEIAYAAADDSTSAATVVLSCVETGIQVQLEDRITRKSMTRVIDLARVEPRSRNRMAALTVAEFVMASWLELRLSTQAPTVPAVGPSVPNVVQEQAARVVEERVPRPPPTAATRSSLLFALGCELAAFSSVAPLAPLVGVDALLSFPLSTHVVLTAGAQWSRGSLRASGDDELAREAARIEVTLASIIASASYAARFGLFELAFGAGARLGFADFQGSLVPGTQLTAEHATVPWGGPLVTSAVMLRATEHVRIVLDLELVVATLRATVHASRDTASGLTQQTSVAELAGVHLGAVLGLGWVF